MLDHRPEHPYVPYAAHGGVHVCATCLAPEHVHRIPRTGRQRPPDRRKRRDRQVFLGIDGEGQTEGATLGAAHRYVLLAASDEAGVRQWYVENQAGLSTAECLWFITNLPDHAKIFAYSFNYDLTKILEDVPDDLLYLLFRPELRTKRLRTGRTIQAPVLFQAPAIPSTHLATGIPSTLYALNLLNTRFTVKRCVSQSWELRNGQPPQALSSYVFRSRYSCPRVIHDIWRFFQGKFTSALSDWKIAPEDVIAHIRHMKDKRADFDKESPADVRRYCFDECMYMAALARRLTEAHEEAGLTLRNYFGAGSSASAMLDKMGVKAHVKEARALVLSRQLAGKRPRNQPTEMAVPIAQAFFGGRFENSVLGPVTHGLDFDAKGRPTTCNPSTPLPLYSYDISSAYPYQLCFLPCLIHGKWTHVQGSRGRTRLTHPNTRAALVHYRLARPNLRRASQYQRRLFRSWAPFPFRLPSGSIAFPSHSGGGHLWKDEYLAGEALFPHTQFLDAWIYETSCSCRPFSKIPHYYAYRLRIGKEGPGITVKGGLNSCYGKLAQSLGGLGPFTSWIWAGLITSGTRAALLSTLSLHRDPRSLLMCATDGIATRERLTMPAPIDTGTGGDDVVDETGQPARKPLGGWEEKRLDKGLFLARPGIYFPINPTEKEIKLVRGRGVGRGAVLEHWKKIQDAYTEAAARGKAHEATVDVVKLSRFVGAKTGVTLGTSEDKAMRVYTRSPMFGRWVERPVTMSFTPLPKREGVGPNGELGLRAFPRDESMPYKRGLVSPEALELKRLTEEALEQPDGGDLGQYDFDG